MVYAHCVRNLDPKQRREFDDSLYGFAALNQAGNDALRDARGAADAVDEARGGIR